MTEETKPFAIFGLYRDKVNPYLVDATSVADARRQYHDRFPGMEGTTFKVISLPDIEIDLTPADGDGTVEVSPS